MIRLLTAGTRIALIAVVLAMSIAAIMFAQATEPAIESAPEADTGAVDNVIQTPGSPGQADSPSRPVPDTTIEVEIQRRINELRHEQMDDRAGTVDWWLAALAVVLGFFGIVVVVGGYIGFTRFREIEAEAKNSAKDAAEHAKDAKRYIEEIERNRDESNKIVQGMNAQTVTDDPDESGEAHQAVKNVLKNPGASLIARAIANAISLQQQGKIKDAIEKWRGVAHIAEGIDDNLAARAWFSVGYLRWDKNPEDCIFAYDQAILLNPDSAASYTNRGVAKHKLGRHEAALADHDEAIRLNPNFADAYTNRGLVKHELGRHEAALADHDEAIRLNPNLAEAYLNRGSTKTLLGLKDDARKDFEIGFELARNANNASLVAEATQLLRNLASGEGS